MRDQETEAAIEEAEIRNMELQLKKKMFEQVIKTTSIGLDKQSKIVIIFLPINLNMCEGC